MGISSQNWSQIQVPFNLLKPDVWVFNKFRKDITGFALVSDGITACFDNKRVAEIVESGVSDGLKMNTICEKVIKKTSQAWEKVKFGSFRDDISIIIVAL